MARVLLCIFSIFFLIPQHLEAQGWYPQASGTTKQFLGVSFADAQTGVAVGVSGTIKRTTNGGTNWTGVSSGTSVSLNDVRMLTPLSGWIVGASGKLLKTTNGGTSWSFQSSGTTSDLNAIWFSGSSVATIVGSGGVIRRTVDGGTTWASQTSGTSYGLLGVAFADVNNGYAVGECGTILHTTNGGSTWTAQSSGKSYALYSVITLDVSRAVVSGANGLILQTTNGGTTWTSIASGTGVPLYQVVFRSASKGTIVGGSGTILQTTNGGNSWTGQTSGVAQPLHAVCFSDEYTGSAVGVNGNVLRTLTGGVACPTISLTPPPLPGGQIGSPYSTTVSASGGAAPYDYIVTSGLLPPGLTLSASGILSGTPTALGSYAFTVTAYDDNNCQGLATYTIAISCAPLTVAPDTLLHAGVSTFYTQSLSASGGAIPYSYLIASGSLPAGLTLSPAGLLSGTPTSAGVSSFVVRVSDAAGCSTLKSYTLSVSCPTISLTPSFLPNAVAGEVYTQTLAGGGGLSPYTFALTSGSLPAGVVLSPSGVISGTPTGIGTSTFTISATDAEGCSGSGAYAITVGCPVISLLPASFPDGAVGISYHETVTGVPGISPWSYAVSAGALPPGLSLSSPGILSGIPTLPGTFTFTITGQDARACIGSGSYTMVVSCPTIGISPTALPDGMTGQGYSATLSSTGGTAPYTYSILSGALPSGMTLSPSGSISGVPTTEGSSNVTIKVLDGHGCEGIANYSIAIDCPSISIAPSTFPGGTVGSGYNLQLTSAGGSSPYVYTIEVGILPAGLVLSPAGLLSGTPTQSGSFPVTIRATDANGCEGSAAGVLSIGCPVITLSDLPGGTVGQGYAETLVPTGGESPYAFAVTGGLLPAGMALSSTGQLTGTPSSSGSSSFTITATDARGCEGTRTYNVSMICPAIDLSALPDGPAGAPYSASIIASGGTPAYNFMLASGSLPAGLTLGTGGLVSGTPTASGMYTFAVTATDLYGCSGTASYTVEIACQPLSLNPAFLPNGTIGTGYTESVSATGGTAPHIFAVASGTLPPGLALSASGIVSGMPSTNGTFSFVVSATDVYGCTGTRPYSIDISACPTIALSPTVLTGADAGTPFTSTITSAGGTAPYSYSVALGSLPVGLTLTGSGLLTGTPVSAGTYTFTIAATDAGGCVGLQSYAMVVCGPMTLSGLPGGSTGVSYSEILTPTGGTAPYLYSITSGSLPPGLVFASSGVIAGVPTTPGTYAFTATVLDANGCSSGTPLSITIGCPAVTLSPASLPDAAAGVLYTQTIIGGGGAPPYVYAIENGLLPPGVTLSSSGVISGIPTTTGSYAVVLRATDSYGCVGSLAIGIDVVCPVIVIGPSALAGAVVGSAYAEVMTAGGTAPHTFSVSAGSLPPGLTLSPAGVLGGTPTASGAFAFTVSVNDASGCSGVRNYMLNVSCPVLGLNPATLPDGATGAAYSQTLVATGGTAPYTFTVSSGVIPVGLTLASSGLLSGTPLLAGASTFEVTAIDVRGCSVTMQYALSIACPPIVPGPASPLAGHVGHLYSQILTVTGGMAPYTFVVTAGALPPGIVLSPTGVLSGTPTSVGSFTFTASVTDGQGCTGSASISLMIECLPIALSPPILPGGTTGSLYYQQLNASGGTPLYTFTIAGGSLPPGLSLSGSGVISGSPSAAGSYAFSLQVLDAQGCTSIQPFAMAVVCPVIGISPVSISPGIEGVAYEAILSGTGGAAPYTFGLASGTLPDGLSLSPEGVISGTPQSQTIAPVVVRVTDANGCEGAQPYIVWITTAPVFVVVPDTLLFPGTLVGESSPDSVMVFNTGSGPLTVYSASSTSGNFTVWPLQAVIPAGNSQKFSVLFNPAGTGAKTGTILFTHNAGGSPDSVHLSGSGTAPVFTVFTMVSFGQVEIGSARVDSVRIVNTGSTTLTISSVVTDHAEFSVFPGSAILAPGGSQLFLVAFVPSIIGAKEGNLVFTHNADGSPSMIPFSGSGIVHVVLRKFRDADGDNATEGDRFPKRWMMGLYRTEVLPESLVVAVDSSELIAPVLEAGTYIAVEADSGAAWTRLNGNGTRSDTFFVDGTVSMADTFVNFRRNTITVSVLEDLDGSFSTGFDRVLRPWYLELRRDSVDGQLVASGHSGSLVVPNLGDGIYYALESDSAHWANIGRMQNGIASPDTSSWAMILLTEGASPQVEFLKARRDFFVAYRSFTPEELGQKATVKKKPHAVRFYATFVNTAGGSVDGLNITFYSTGLTSNVTTMETYAPFTNAASYNGKLWQFSGAWIANGESVTVCAIANKNKAVAIASWNWTVNGLPLDKQASFKPTEQYRLLPMPNFANVRSELYALGAFNATNGLVVGVPNPSDPKSHGWVRLRSGRAMQRSMTDRGLHHTETTHGFDIFASGKPFVKELKELLPRKHNNKLFAEAVALKTGIYASAIGITPPGFGELIYDETPGNALCGLTLMQIAARVDSALSYWNTPSFLGWDYPLYTAVLEKVNRSFEGAMDTVGWSTGLKVKGVQRLVDVPFLHPNPGAIPFTIDRIAAAGLQPKAFELYQNYPNPFNPTTNIAFDLMEPAFVTLKLYNLLGQEVGVILDREEMDAGRNDLEVQAAGLPSGVYFYRMTVEAMTDDGEIGRTQYVDTRKMMLVK